MCDSDYDDHHDPDYDPYSKKRPNCVFYLLLLLFSVGFIYKLSDLILPGGRGGRGGVVVKTIVPNDNPACPIPQLDPYDKSILHLLNVTRPSVNCPSKYPLLFSSTRDSRIVPEGGSDHFRKLGYGACCYRTVKRADTTYWPDDNQQLSPDCYPLSLTNHTKIPDEHEFIAIFCRKINGTGGGVPVDVHAFIPMKGKSNKKEVTKKDSTKLNVVIFGIDATSRMNFLRTMPRSRAFLKKEMDAVEMLGYNKIAENSLPNLVPLLTSQTLSELSGSCRTSGLFYDECPFIWKTFSEQGYATYFAEDAPSIAIFNFYKRGFGTKQPTDYYIRPLVHWATRHVGSHPQINGNLCFGSRLTFQLLLDYMEKYVHRMSESHNNFFSFTWATALTHDRQSNGALGDAHLLKTLMWLKGSGYLNNTVFILMSDHGMRMGNFRNTIQGQLEDRMPFMYLVFPDGFKKQYSRAYRNLQSNHDKLMTTLDVHQTLLDILDPGKIDEAHLKVRERKIMNSSSSPLPRALSLFLPIPESRTCEMAGIEMNYCSCNYMRPTPLNSNDNTNLTDVVKAAIAHINHRLLNNHTHLCSILELRNLTLAQRTGNTDIDWEAYIINFITDPGGAEFEAVVDRTDKGNWTVRGKVERTNMYKGQSHCVKDTGAKPYCYCSGDDNSVLSTTPAGPPS